MRNIVDTLAILASSKIIEKKMKSCVNLHYTKEKTLHIFDKTKRYFLYIHVPFCEQYCSFCSFHKFKYNEFDCKNYFKKLRVEILKVKELGFNFDTLYIGGGTPLINEDELLRTIECTKELFNIKEISCETTPNHIKPEVLKNFKGVINRLSIGVQSFDDNILKSVSRYDKYGPSAVQQEKIAKIIEEFPIVSLDLIFNFPNQTKEMLIKDLKIAKSLGAEQIITYPLMSKHSGNIFKDFKILKKSREYEFYKVIKDEMKNYYTTNAWAFSKSKKSIVDEYTVDNNEYIGIGSGAFTHINRRLYVNAYDLNDYGELINNNSNAIIALTDEFTHKDTLRYHFMLNLFGESIDIEKFNAIHKCSLKRDLFLELYLLQKVDAIFFKDNKIYPTKFGEYLSMVMVKEFYIGMDRIRAKLKKTIKS